MLYLLPGMGADHRMYGAAEWLGLTDARSIDWPHFEGETTIAAVSERMIEEAGIVDGDVLVGSSLGGMVACEIASRLKLRSLALIGSAIAPSEISRLLATLHPLAPLAPLEFVRRCAGKVPGELAEMFSQADPGFVRAMCLAIFDWPGLDTDRITPVRIHGRHDRVIPPPARVDCLVDGGHLIAMTHPAECVRALRSLGIV